MFECSVEEAGVGNGELHSVHYQLVTYVYFYVGLMFHQWFNLQDSRLIVSLSLRGGGETLRLYLANMCSHMQTSCPLY